MGMRILKWVETETRLLWLPFLFIGVLILNVLLFFAGVVGSTRLEEWLGFPLSTMTIDPLDWLFALFLAPAGYILGLLARNGYWISIVLFSILAAVSEEIVYRTIPIYVAWRLNSRKLLWVAILASSILFAFGHKGFSSLLIQGVAGVLYSIAYLKTGGWNGKILKPTLFVIALHVTWNEYVSEEIKAMLDFAIEELPQQ